VSTRYYYVLTGRATTQRSPRPWGTLAASVFLLMLFSQQELTAPVLTYFLSC